MSFGFAWAIFMLIVDINSGRGAKGVGACW